MQVNISVASLRLRVWKSDIARIKIRKWTSINKYKRSCISFLSRELLSKILNGEFIIFLILRLFCATTNLPPPTNIAAIHLIFLLHYI
jgi:hypothetical protein